MKMAYHAPNIFSEDDILSVKEENAFLWVYGKIIFNDFMGNSHEKGFSYKWIFTTKRFGADHTPAYNYQKRIVKESSWRKRFHSAFS